jgi:protein PhnA
MDNTYPDSGNFICPDCSHEWSANTRLEEVAEKRIHKDANSNILNDGDTVTLIKDLKKS